jgi:hypothetical protein|nr:MAG TPA: hypothetical protein [Caudoviricetes sp.]
MARKIIPLRPQKQVDQAIKNFILDKSHRETRVTLCLGGSTAISLKIFKTSVRAYRTYSNNHIFLDYYYSEDLATDPELIDYEMPPEPYYTYDEILQRGEEVKRYGRVISDDPIGEINVKDSKCVNGKLVPNDFYKDYPIQPPSLSIVDPFRFKSLADSVRESLNEQPAPSTQVKASPLKPESIGVSEKKEAVSTSPKTNENDDLKESLERRLRLLDLKIEREEILNQLAAL